MSKATHRDHFPDKANCRNAANGIMKRKDGVGAERLEVVCYDAAPSGLYDGESGGLFAPAPEPPFDDELDKIAWLRAAGFEVARITSYNVCYTKLLRPPGRVSRSPYRRGTSSRTS